MINSIIFSKDRACQCDLTLQSLEQNAGNLLSHINVLYDFSDDEFGSGYFKLRNKWRSKVNFYRQKDFQKDLNNLTKSTHPYTVYFTDDDIFYRKLKARSSVFIITNTEFTCFSLRLGKNTYIQDPHRGTQTILPDFKSWHDDVLYWNWRQMPSHSNFAYPLSVDGHIFETNMLLRYIDEFEYDNPNSFEGRIQRFNDKLPDKIACFTESHVINTPLNRVQETCTNLAGKYYPAEAAELNDCWLDNYRISLQKMDFSNIIGCHQELQLHLTKETK